MSLDTLAGLLLLCSTGHVQGTLTCSWTGMEPGGLYLQFQEEDI